MHDHPNILLATDLSARSDRPFDRAASLARELGGSITLAHVLEPGAAPRGPAGMDELRATILEDLPDAGVPIHLLIERGSAPSLIAEAADREGSDLIVVGAARYNNITDFFLGTAVDYLVRHAHVPVLVVKRRAAHAYRDILIATDFSACALESTRVAAEIFPHARLNLVHAYRGAYESRLNPDEVRAEAHAEAERELADFVSSPELAAARPRLHTQLEVGPLASVILARLRAQPIDLLVLGTHGRSPIVHAALGSRASDLLESMPCDVLMVRERAREG
ncbi:universal stress protein [Edaphosphingomonas haloaromaticamans]|uniref:Universal stress protein UspE n=1 Tax=Edaphosphingomonas haloaromaticamans TaxID=653954 RepID=A0A1S1HHV0_9SPHN|nr:universal stress protein [Sphingomonas haloaromaticamans]OHT20793.1 universal stress protein UspE [Sphingomonas haloaromaticamans]